MIYQDLLHCWSFSLANLSHTDEDYGARNKFECIEIRFLCYDQLTSKVCACLFSPGLLQKLEEMDKPIVQYLSKEKGKLLG